MARTNDDLRVPKEEDYSGWTPVVRRRQALVFITFLCFIPAMTVSQRLGLPFFEAGLAYGAVYLFLGWRMDRTACARCGKRVFRRGLFSNPFSPRCMNCGLDHWLA